MRYQGRFVEELADVLGAREAAMAGGDSTPSGSAPLVSPGATW
jgi:hypothetical protein